MRIAILMTNTDESAFAQRHPKDGEKFTRLMQLARPNWDYVVYSVKDGVFPESLAGIDGALITGSPASVHDRERWIGRLEALVIDWQAAGVPIYGACFGHQVIAKALGGKVEKNTGGWVFGAVETQLEGEGTTAAYAAHVEQVTELPKGAEATAQTPGCPIAGFAIGHGIATTQYHPEMDEGFIAALVEDQRDYLGQDVAAAAEKSLTLKPDQAAWAERIARFFEAAWANSAR